MDLKSALLKEHSKKQCDVITRYISSDKKKFAELMTIFFKSEYRLTQRAAWPMSYCVRYHPELIKPYFDRLLQMLDKKGAHDSVGRNILRLLQDVEIPKRWHGRVMNTCFEIISSADKPVAFKAFSLTILGNLGKEYPSIKQEIKLIIQERWDYETAAFHSRARKLLKNL